MQNAYQEVRNLFKAYFRRNEHTIVPSSNLVPKDPTLLFTNSGMVQFKDIFTGTEKTNLRRATSVQKCIRAGGKHNDLENVGFTNRHHTFFEMLGNFSFGDYFKEEAIYFAWKFLTEELSLPEERLYVTVFHEDDEAFNIWQNLTGFSDDKIIKIKTNDNFWSMGPCGPCGPCSEIFYDYGDKVAGGLPGTEHQDGARYTEIWNLVFMQFNQVDEKTRLQLEKKGVDTGMGLERLISVIEGKTDNYETSLFEQLIRYSKSIIGKVSEGDIAYRILADHARSTAFLIADGVHPASEGRGYVLRRIIRRALRHLHMIGYKGGDFAKITGKVIDLMSSEYSELSDARNLILTTAHDEEERFMSTLPVGMRFLENEMSVMKEGEKLAPSKAFMLYDTFGFPLDITNDILKSKKLSPVSDDEFEGQMRVQKERSKKSWKGSGDEAVSEELVSFASKFSSGASFDGYEKLKMKSTILGIFKDYIVLDETCFYPEGGGQIGDTGFFNQIPVLDTIKIKDIILHKLASTAGLKVGDMCDIEVSIEDRKASANAHSATHLLHHFLREKFGESVVQKGSLVARDKLRFDFSFNKPLTFEEIHEIETLVNLEIVKSVEVKSYITTLEEAKKNGAIAFFGEKYAESVRALKIGKSHELCGGTHVSNTNQICAFKIIYEGSVASGVRRIEALTGKKALSQMLYAGYNLELLRAGFKMPKISENTESEFISKDEAIVEVASLQEKLLAKNKEIADLNLRLAEVKEGFAKGDFYIKCVKNLSADLSRQLISKLKNKAKVIILMCEFEGKNSLYISSNSGEYSAIEIGKSLSQKLGGKGGGSPEFANFGGILEVFDEEKISKML
jgi:alanyl-tRNA synthetase